MVGGGRTASQRRGGAVYSGRSLRIRYLADEILTTRNSEGPNAKCQVPTAHRIHTSTTIVSAVTRSVPIKYWCERSQLSSGAVN